MNYVNCALLVVVLVLVVMCCMNKSKEGFARTRKRCISNMHQCTTPNSNCCNGAVSRSNCYKMCYPAIDAQLAKQSINAHSGSTALRPSTEVDIVCTPYITELNAQHAREMAKMIALYSTNHQYKISDSTRNER